MSNPNVGKVFNLGGGSGGGGSLKLEGLTVTTLPKKQTYKSGESFNPEGMVVTASYGYGITAPVTGYTVSPQILTDGVTEVTITYTEGRVTKTATVSVTVEKVLKSIAVTTEPQKMTYDYLEQFDPEGMVVTATFSDESQDKAEGYTYPKTAFTTLGQQDVKIEYTYEGVSKSTTLQVTVKAIEVAIPTQKEAPRYTGLSQTPEWNDYDPIKMELSGETEAIEAGKHDVTFTAKYGYEFPDAQSEATVSWEIKRAVIDAVPTQSNALIANGSPQYPEWTGYERDKLTIGGETVGTEAREYTATFTPTKNYEWWDETIETKNATWIITSVLVTIPTQTNIPTYDGSPKTPEWENFDETNSSVQVTEQTDAGEYDAVFTLINGIWSDRSTGKKTIKWKIDRAVLDEVPKQDGSLVYDGNPKIPTWNEKYDASKMTVSVDAKVNAGTDYTASFTPTKNYKWWDETTDAKTATWAISKAPNTITLAPQSITLNANTKTSKFTVTRKGNGTITATSKNTAAVAIGEINQNSGEVEVKSVNDTSGESVVTVKVAESDNYLAPQDATITVKASFREYFYGYDLSLTDQNPATRVTYPADVENSEFEPAKMNFGSAFSYGGWPSVPGEKFMPRPCMLKFDGTVDYYLDPADYTQKAEGGASDVKSVAYEGNAMMEWPKIYTKRWEDSSGYHFRCSDVKVDDDYECWCNYDKNNNEIPHFYTPIYFGSKDSSNRLRSISGQSNMVSQNATTEINYAKANGADSWYTEVLADRQLINDLLTMMGKSTDGQTVYGNGVCSASAAIAPGTMDSKGMFWGASDKTSGVKVFGMENWWGNIFRRIAGWTISGGVQKVKITRGTKDGTTAEDYNTDGTGYTEITGVKLTSSGYISKMKTEKFGRFPMAASGSSSTYEADYVYADSGSGYYANVGGDGNDDLHCGPFYADLYATPSFTATGIGAALSCKPLAAA